MGNSLWACLQLVLLLTALSLQHQLLQQRKSRLIFNKLTSMSSSASPSSASTTITGSSGGGSGSVDVDGLIAERVESRLVRAYARADEIKALLEGPPYFLEITDEPYKLGGGSTYRARNMNTTEGRGLLDSLKAMQASPTAEGIAELLALMRDDETKDLDRRELQGRKFADAAFELSLLGVRDEAIFTYLVEQQGRELARWGLRASVRAHDIVKLCERLACAGVRDGGIYLQAARLLRDKGDAGGDTAEYLLAALATAEALDHEATGLRMSLGNNSRPKMAMWTYLSRQRKAGKQNLVAENCEVAAATAVATAAAPLPPSLATLFADPSLPLVVDLGCGLGVSLLGLAEARGQEVYNFCGVELNSESARYGQGIAARWGLGGRVAFVQLECCEALERLEREYPGPCALVAVQFPTPFKLRLGSAEAGSQTAQEPEDGGGEEGDDEEEDGGGGGNRQLPDTDEFMVGPHLLRRAEALLRPRATYPPPAPGLLYVQSNVEDVAVWMRQAVEDHTGLRPPSRAARLLAFSHGQAEAEGMDWAARPEPEAALTLRQKRWLDGSPQAPRAHGPGWLAGSPLPACAHSETEVMCIAKGKTVYRVLFECQASDEKN